MSQIVSDVLLSDASADELRIGGMTTMTTIDYPGELAAVIFLFRAAECVASTVITVT